MSKNSVFFIFFCLYGIVKKKMRKLEEKILKLAKKGDEQAMFSIYKQYVDGMYNVCVRMLVNTQDAEDVIQESFVSAFEHLKTFKGKASFGSWLKRIVINKSINFLKTKRYDLMINENIEAMEDETEECEVPEIEWAEIQQHIKNLPPKARVVFTLYLLEGYKHKEIAKLLNISESTSKSQYIRAKSILRNSFKIK